MNMNVTEPLSSKDIDISTTTPIRCEKCGNETFTGATMFRKVSALLTKTGQEGLIPIETVACVNCGTPSPYFLPRELRTPVVTSSVINR